MENKIKIALIGATGKAGKSILKELIHQKFHVKILLRNPDNFMLYNPLIQIVKGDVRNYQSVLTLLNGCYAVINAIGQTKGESPLFSKASENIFKAMDTYGDNRFISITGLSIKTPADKKGLITRLFSALMRMFFREIIRDKQLEYSIIAKSKLDWTIVRIPYIEIKEKPKELRVNQFDCDGTYVYPGSLVVFIVDQIRSADYLQMAPFVSY